MPRDVREWLPPEHLRWKVLDLVQLLDLSVFENSYRDDGRGGVAYPPASLIALLLYCYSKGIRSSRRIEQACWDDVGCRIITADRRVDHSTVARFVRRHRAALNSLFVQVLSLCGRRGLVDLSAVAVDGSPMKANASRAANRRLQRLEETISQCEKEIHAQMEDVVDHALSVEADGSAAQRDGEDACDNWPRLSRLYDRLARAHLARDRLHERAMPSPTEIRIKAEAAERMVARAEKRLAAETKTHQERLKKYELRVREDRAAGRRGANGRPPVPMEHKTVLVRQRARLVKMRAWLERARTPRPAPSPKSRACLSDPDSRLIPGKRGGYLPAAPTEADRLVPDSVGPGPLSACGWACPTRRPGAGGPTGARVGPVRSGAPWDPLSARGRCSPRAGSAALLAHPRAPVRPAEGRTGFPWLCR